MKLYVDTSALVKYYYPETDSEAVERAILRADSILVCELVIVEFASALMKKVRTKELREDEKALIWESFTNDLRAEPVEMVTLSEADYFGAAQLIHDHGAVNSLRTLDALQITAAMRVGDARFLCADLRLVEMARMLGLGIEPLD